MDHRNADLSINTDKIFARIERERRTDVGGLIYRTEMLLWKLTGPLPKTQRSKVPQESIVCHLDMQLAKQPRETTSIARGEVAERQNL